MFSLFYQLIECWSSFAISWCRWNWSYDKDYTHGLADLFCHITKNPNPNCKPVSGFQILLKKCCSLHKKFPHEKSRLYQPSLSNNVESPNDDHSQSRISLWTRFIVLTTSAMNSVLYCKWTKPDILQSKRKNNHSRAIPLAAKYTLIFCFYNWKCATCDVIFMDWVKKWQGVFVWMWL